MAGKGWGFKLPANLLNLQEGLAAAAAAAKTTATALANNLDVVRSGFHQNAMQSITPVALNAVLRRTGESGRRLGCTKTSCDGCRGIGKRRCEYGDVFLRIFVPRDSSGSVIIGGDSLRHGATHISPMLFQDTGIIKLPLAAAKKLKYFDKAGESHMASPRAVAERRWHGSLIQCAQLESHVVGNR